MVLHSLELSWVISRGLFYCFYVVCNNKINLEIKNYIYSKVSCGEIPFFWDSRLQEDKEELFSHGFDVWIDYFQGLKKRKRTGIFIFYKTPFSFRTFSDRPVISRISERGYPLFFIKWADSSFPSTLPFPNPSSLALSRWGFTKSVMSDS